MTIKNLSKLIEKQLSLINELENHVNDLFDNLIDHIFNTRDSIVQQIRNG